MYLSPISPQHRWHQVDINSLKSTSVEVLAPWNLAGATELLPQKAGCDMSASTPLLPALFDNSGLETYFKNHCISHGMKIRICMRYSMEWRTFMRLRWSEWKGWWGETLEEFCTTWLIDADNGKGGAGVSPWTKAPCPEHISLAGSQRELFTVGFPVIYILHAPVQLSRIASAIFFF